MKKRLISLAVVLLMILPVVLTGCDSGRKKTGRPDLTTVALAMIKGENTTDAGIEAVEKAMNRIIERDFGVHIELQAYPEDEYLKIMQGKLDNIAKEIAEEKALKEAAESYAKYLKQQGITTLPETTVAETTSELMTYLDEEGEVQYVYPEAGENQVDIFLVNSLTEYHRLIGSGDEPLLYDMSEQLSEKHKSLRKVIHPNFMNAVTYMGSSVYGIPNNHIVGENTYLLLNKQICTEELDWAGTEFSTLQSLNKYLKAVATYCPDAVPLYNLPEDSVMHLTDEFSILGHYYVPGVPEDAAAGSPPRNVLQNANYLNYLTSCYNYRANGWVTEGDYVAIPDDGKTYAAAFLKGGDEIAETYGEDYYVITYSNALVSSHDLFRSVYCVSSYSEVPAICMDIIAALTEDAELRNIFQYGAQNVTYTVDESNDNLIVPNTEGECIWDPNPIYTGNQFILEPNAGMTEGEMKLAENNWALGKSRNATMILDVYAAFPLKYIDADTIARRYENDPAIEYDETGAPNITLEEYVAQYESKFYYTEELMSEIIKYSAEVMERIKNFKEYVDEETGETVTISDFLNDIKNETTADPFIAEAIKAGEKNPDTPTQQYVDWRTNGGMVLDWN